MIKQTKFAVLAMLVSAGFAASFPAAAEDITITGGGDVPYVIDGRNVVARSGFGLCWRTGYWSPAAAEAVMAGEFPVGCSCEEDLLPKEKCTPPEPVVAVPPPVAPAVEKVKLAADALFDFDSAQLTADGKVSLNGVAAQAKSMALEVILAVGHTDRIGSEAYNMKLSERRAAAVKDYLMGHGIDANRIYTEGKGESQPVTGSDCSGVRGKALISCLQPDRRVEIEVIGTR